MVPSSVYLESLRRGIDGSLAHWDSVWPADIEAPSHDTVRFASRQLVFFLRNATISPNAFRPAFFAVSTSVNSRTT